MTFAFSTILYLHLYRYFLRKYFPKFLGEIRAYLVPHR